MSRLTLRLPETLHQRLETLAEMEHTSLNQFVVYALTQYAMRSFTLVEVPQESVERQQASFEALRARLRQGSPAEIRQALEAREGGEAEPFLLTEPGRRLRGHLDRALAEKLGAPAQAGS